MLALLEWVVWGVALLFTLGQVPSAFNADGGVKTLAWRFIILAAIGMCVTTTTSLSKFHLLWWMPLAYIANMLFYGWALKRGALKYANSLRATPQRTMLDEVQDKGGVLIVRGYRTLAEQQSVAPTIKTTDSEILEIYRRVGSEFRAVADERGEHLPAGWINHIVWKFLQVKELAEKEMFDQHLAYELNKFRTEGLRDDYKHDLDLF